MHIVLLEGLFGVNGALQLMKVLPLFEKRRHVMDMALRKWHSYFSWPEEV